MTALTAESPDGRGGQVLMNHGRLLGDMQLRDTWAGMVLDWTVEDLDADGDDLVVARGTATDPSVAWLEVTTAALHLVKVRNPERTNPVLAAMMREQGLR